jgi:hypothetical protein
MFLDLLERGRDDEFAIYNLYVMATEGHRLQKNEEVWIQIFPRRLDAESKLDADAADYA